MKFGGAAFKSPVHFSNVASILASKKGKKVVIVSAIEHVTDSLHNLARQISHHPPARELDMLLSVGERVSMSLLAMALHEKGISAASLTGSQSGVITSGNHNNAQIVDVKPQRIIDTLAKNDVVVIAGFQGVSSSKEITTLGRGGSDISAVAIAKALGVKYVTFYKDVKGIYTKDPKESSDAVLIKQLSFEKALSFTNSAVDLRAIALAKESNTPLFIQSFKFFHSSSTVGTWIGNAQSDGARI